MLRTYIFLATSFFMNHVIGQKALTGPVCVSPGVEYQYSLNILGSANWKVCVSGGSIVGSNASCVEGSTSTRLNVVWAKNGLNGLTITGAVSEKLAISVIDEFDAGLIEDSIISGHELSKKLPIIYCTNAKGGACSSSFIYNWEMSADQVLWINVVGEYGQNLAYKELVKETVYFRRKVTNTRSNTVGYSNVVHVFVNPEVK